MVREIFRLSNHHVPEVMEPRPVPDMTLTAVFAPGGCKVGGGEDVGKELRKSMEKLGVKWVDDATATVTIIILTGALLKSSAKRVCVLF